MSEILLIVALLAILKWMIEEGDTLEGSFSLSEKGGLAFGGI